mgnify:FL=1
MYQIFDLTLIYFCIMSGKVNKFDCISIIIPVYNGALYITNLIYNLTFGQKFHNISLDILVIDDKSTDDTLEVLQALNFPNLRIIPLEQNYGTSHARNIGLDAAWGDYILFIDADDTISDAFFYIY